MPNKFTIDIGPDGFQGLGENPKFKVKKNRTVEFNLVNGAAPVNVYFSAGSPFGSNPVVPVGSSGSGELSFQEGTVGKTFIMEVEAPEQQDGSATVMSGKTGDIEVEPYP